LGYAIEIVSGGALGARCIDLRPVGLAPWEREHEITSFWMEQPEMMR
jgi:hypothetical protein